ncbi:DUF2971 domain-containing protein [Microbacterium terrisoli]|uniref:DUF2971 domain-containing protein n=1 Tax=Microbacterium terrisoli TaxID=3242192 RepID=UPI002805BD9E|nr:DUF2971 domain-containing protein [Microbacterium protaetiae]
MVTLLAHYTSSVGIRGIVEGGSLWASHVAFLNDASEFRYAFDVSRDIIERITILNQVWQPKHPELAELITSETTHLQRGGLPDVFVTSLSTLSEDLSQWRGYTHPGDGYTIQFDAEALEHHVASLGWRLVPVVYGPSADMAVAYTAVDAFTRLDNGTYATSREAFDAFTRDLAVLAPTLKDHAFERESEWRLISPLGVDPSQVKWRSGPSFLVPYVEVPLPSPDSGVVLGFGVGPGPNGDLASASLLKYVHQMGYHVGVGVPGIPYRPW